MVGLSTSIERVGGATEFRRKIDPDAKDSCWRLQEGGLWKV